ncbi:LOW QUALITY PROTEIN: hypothetical protein U9M48_025557, partial [Paspalum notatum var. saurae]
DISPYSPTRTKPYSTRAPSPEPTPPVLSSPALDAASRPPCPAPVAQPLPLCAHPQARLRVSSAPQTCPPSAWCPVRLRGARPTGSPYAWCPAFRSSARTTHSQVPVDQTSAAAPIQWKISQRHCLERSSNGFPQQLILILSLLCPSNYTIEAQLRDAIHIGCGVSSVTVALVSLCSRFQNLRKVEFNYSGWMTSHGMQLNNEGLRVVSSCCHSLADLTLSFCSRCLINLTLELCDGLTDDGLAEFVRARKLESLTIEKCSQISQKAVQGAAKTVHYTDDCPGFKKWKNENPSQTPQPFSPSFLRNPAFTWKRRQPLEPAFPIPRVPLHPDYPSPLSLVSPPVRKGSPFAPPPLDTATRLGLCGSPGRRRQHACASSRPPARPTSTPSVQGKFSTPNTC